MSDNELPRFALHICPLDKECRSYDAPWRIYITLFGWHLGIAMRPSGKYAQRFDWKAYRTGEQILWKDNPTWIDFHPNYHKSKPQ